MITYKVRHKGYVVNVYIPEQATGSRSILLPGLPMSMNINAIVDSLLKNGSTVYYPYYSGSYDSGGTFSPKNSIKDIKSFFELAKKEKLTELYFGKTLSLPPASKIALIAQSFGAVVALHGHSNLFDKVILLSPALLYNVEEIGGEKGREYGAQMESLMHLLKNAHPYTYRIGLGISLKRFLFGRNPLSREKAVIRALESLVCPTRIVHGLHDSSVPVEISKRIQEKIKNSQLQWEYVEAGHSLSSYPSGILNSLAKFAAE